MKDSFQLLKKYIYFYNSLKTHSLTRLRGKSRKTKEREASWNEGSTRGMENRQSITIVHIFPNPIFNLFHLIIILCKN